MRRRQLLERLAELLFDARRLAPQLPGELIVHPLVVVSRKTGEALIEQTKSAEPTPALRELMRDGD